MHRAKQAGTFRNRVNEGVCVSHCFVFGQHIDTHTRGVAGVWWLLLAKHNK
jgi:hypothetical protein